MGHFVNGSPYVHPSDLPPTPPSIFMFRLRQVFTMVLFIQRAAAVFLTCVALQTHGFAISSSSSSGKKLLTNNKAKGGRGFGAPSVANFTPDTSPELSTLRQFLTSQGGVLDDIQIGYNNQNSLRGLYATRALKKGDIICKIPSDLALALSDPQLGGSDVPTFAHSARNLLQMYMHDDQFKDTWQPYLDTLPTMDSSQFDETPDFWSMDEIRELEFPRAVKQALQRKEQVENLALEENLTLEELQFVTWLVSSRCFLLQITAGNDPQSARASPPSKSIRVLVPYIDMINHSSNAPNAELHLIDPEKDEAWFAIRALKPIPKGSEITIQYGSGVDSSVELLNAYGFVPTSNKFDAMMLKKGGEDCIESLNDWTTTLQEDEEEFKSAEGNRRKTLALRIKLKKAYADL